MDSTAVGVIITIVLFIFLACCVIASFNSYKDADLSDIESIILPFLFAFILFIALFAIGSACGFTTLSFKAEGPTAHLVAYGLLFVFFIVVIIFACLFLGIATEIKNQRRHDHN